MFCSLFSPNPASFADLSCPCGCFKPGEVFDTEFLVKEHCFLRTDPTDIRKLTNACPDFRFQPFEIYQFPRIEDLPDLGSDMCPDPGKVPEFPAFGYPADIFGKCLNPVCCPPVCDRFELHVFDLEEVGNLV
jgi:hypothetical protein